MNAKELTTALRQMGFQPTRWEGNHDLGNVRVSTACDGIVLVLAYSGDAGQTALEYEIKISDCAPLAVILKTIKACI